MSTIEAKKQTPVERSLDHAHVELRLCAQLANSWCEVKRAQVQDHLRLAESHAGNAASTLKAMVSMIEEAARDYEVACHTTSDYEFACDAESKAEALRWALDVLAGKAGAT